MIRRLIILLLIVGCEEPSQHGCLDSQATNYDATASIDNNTCTYIDSCGVIDIDLGNDFVRVQKHTKSGDVTIKIDNKVLTDKRFAQLAKMLESFN